MAFITGTAGNDTVTPTSISGGVSGFPTVGDDYITTSDGADLVDGGNGNDTIDGWIGDDTLIGGEGND